MQCGAVQYSSVQCSVVQCSSVQYNTVRVLPNIWVEEPAALSQPEIPDSLQKYSAIELKYFNGIAGILHS